MSAAENSRRQWFTPIRVLATILVLLALGVAAGFGVAWQQERSLRLAGEQAEAAAIEVAAAMTSYDYRSVESDFGWDRELSTARFQEFYAAASEPVRELVSSLRLTARGTVVASAAHVQDVDHVDVLLFVDQRITSADDAERSLDQPRITLSMVKVEGRWLVDELDLHTVSGN